MTASVRLPLAALLLAAAIPGLVAEEDFRPPAIPLVTFDPYLSVWCEADHLTDGPTRHWTRREHPLTSLIRIDGTAYRLLGDQPHSLPAFPQTRVQVLPTRTIVDFANSAIQVTLTFMTPALPNDLDALGLPLSFISWQVRARDGGTHAVELYDAASALLTVNQPNQAVVCSRATCGALTALRAGTKDQPVLGSSGDDHRIDWGYAYLAAPSAEATAAIGAAADLAASFAANGRLPAADEPAEPRPANERQPTLGLAFALGRVGEAAVSRHAVLAYDEIYSIKYFGQNLRPYWRRNGAEAGDMLTQAERDYPALARRCAAFDDELMADLTRVGGRRYALLTACAYRQCLAANGLAADAAKQPLLFTKENTSNGDIATTDVFFPQDPIFIFLSPTLAKASLVPILAYGASKRWKFPCAPHDLGTYPIAKGTDDGGEAMPVEESGNMLILCDAIAHAEGNADFITPWWPALSRWAAYLEQFGLDPEQQLCTDDFMGHLAHNANLSVKAIVALAAFGDLCRMRGDRAGAERYAGLARTDAAHWLTVATEAGHSRLAFDKPNTWSQKYNLVWDHILGLNVFPPEVARQELAYYRTVMQRYGVPLDSRTKLTKTDWSFWIATMAEKQDDFEGFISPMYDYFNQTDKRDPLADSYETDNVHSEGMHARPVIGGLFIKMLADQACWKKWAQADRQPVGSWAKLPPRQVVGTVVVPAGNQAPASWRYTTSSPAEGWEKPGFDASSWQEGLSGFGSPGTPGIVIKTVWKSDDIWLVRDITIPADAPADLALLVHHDDDVEVYLDGIRALAEPGWTTAYTLFPVDNQAARARLKPGATVHVAAHNHQYAGGQCFDLGIVSVVTESDP